MAWLIVFIFILFVVYTLVILFYYWGWRAMNSYQVSETAVPKTSFSVIIAARNEENNIGKLLQSLVHQNYPRDLFEIWVVDDHSTDRTAEIVEQFEGVRLLRLAEDRINSYKKKAIERGIAVAKNEWIVCTDADCMVQRNWLLTFSSFINEKKPVFVAAPVSLIPVASKEGAKGGWLYVFQALDFLTLQGITGASVHSGTHSMCNGANLAYRRDIFYEVGGFKGIDDIASGDDMLLMHKIWKRYPNGMGYIKAAEIIVETEAAADWKAFINQRIRWASKATSYDDKRILVVLFLVYLFNLSFLVLFIAGFADIRYFYVLAASWIAKTMVELPFVFHVSRFFKKEILLRYFFFFQPLHILYTIVAGFMGSFGRYEWKGRKVK